MSQAIRYGGHIETLDVEAKEVTLDYEGVSENTYRPSFPNLTPAALALFQAAVDHSPEILGDPFPPLQCWELIGLTRANDTNYPEDTISISYRRQPVEGILSALGLSTPPELVQGTSYTLKLQLTSMQKVVKVYDLNFDNHPLPELPPGCEPIDEFGVGHHLNDSRLLHFRDIYFYTTMTGAEVQAFFQVPVPDDQDTTPRKRAFGCLFDSRDLSIIKIKQYILPQDPYFEKP